MSSVRRRMVMTTVLALLIATCSTGVAGAGAGSGTPRAITIGALFDLSGDGKTLGQASKAALEVAAADLERTSNGDLDITLDIRDTRQNPETAVEEYLGLVADGVRVIVGPQTSGEVRALLETGIDNGPALVVSNGSTASSLAFPADAVFRLVPDDRVEGAAIADLMHEQGQDTVVVTNRVDPGNAGLASSTSAATQGLGGTAVAGPTYPPDTTDFAPAVSALAEKVSALPGGAAVYMAGFEEVADYLAASADNDALARRKFYGGDGSAKSAAILDDTVAAKFAARAGGFPSPLLTVPPRVLRGARSTVEKIERKSGQQADAFSLAAYDALAIGVEALEKAGPDPSTAALRLLFAATADGHDGVTGRIELNDAGDRSTGPFAYWAVCKAGKRGGFAWRTIGTWAPPRDAGEPGTVEVTGCKQAPG